MLIDRERNLKKNFREETVTDLIMASLIGLEPLGIRVDFPYEQATGGDMEWIFVAPNEPSGGRSLRVILQAKRASFAKRRSGGFWHYAHLDHGTPKGKQAQTLVSYTSSAGGSRAVPLYIFYHPKSALAPATVLEPAIEGINLVFARHVAPVVKGGCSTAQKKVDFWRTHFLPLSELLCWPLSFAPAPKPSSRAIGFMVGPSGISLGALGGWWHPDLVCSRLNQLYELQFGHDVQTGPMDRFEPVNGVPDDVRRALEGQTTSADRKELKRPRVIFYTALTTSDPEFQQARGQD